MKILILAVLLTVMQTPSPVPRKASNGPAGASNAVNNQPKDNSNPSSQAQSVPDKNHATQNGNPGYQPTQENTQQSVRVSELPAVALTRDWADWVSWVSNGLLVIVGIVTLGAIIYQAMEMTRATKAMQRSTDASIADSRPWMLVPRGEFGDKIESPPLIPIQGASPHIEVFPHCKFWVKNYGKTPAKIIFLKAELQIGDSQKRPPHSDVFGAKETGTPYIFPQEESESRIAKIREDSPENAGTAIDPKMRFLWLCGFIKYRDTFDREKPIEYETRFCYFYVMDIPGGQWIAGPEEFNTAT